MGYLSWPFQPSWYLSSLSLHPSDPTGGRSSWWGISASRLTISALLVPLQLALNIKNFLFPGGSDGNESACNGGVVGLIPGLGRSPREGNGNPLQYSCQENPMDRGAWWLQSMRSQKSWTQLRDFNFTSLHWTSWHGFCYLNLNLMIVFLL